MSAPVPFGNYSLKTEEKHGEAWFEWCVFVSAPRAVLDTIARVEYTLHPTFADPLRVSHDSQHCFPVYSAGWGAFPLGIEIVFEAGDRQFARHFLQLHENNWPKKQPETLQLSKFEQAVYSTLTNSRFRWRKLTTIAREGGISAEEARAALRTMESRNFVRKAFFTSVGGEELWGATAIVGIAPEPLISRSPKQR